MGICHSEEPCDEESAVPLPAKMQIPRSARNDEEAKQKGGHGDTIPLFLNPMKRPLALLLLACCAMAQEAHSALQGSWYAGVREAVDFRGHWSAIVNSPNAASGTWTLLDTGNQGRMQGSWSARKSLQGWQGTWTARVGSGPPLSGTWEATLQSFAGKTFEDMLKHTLEKQVSGSWRSGRYAGYWVLQGAK
jgi:hypothetical protein